MATRTKISLADIQATWDALEALLDEPGAVSPEGEPSPEIAAWLEENSLAEREKVDGYVVYLRHLDAQQKGLEEVSKMFAGRARTAKNRRDWLLGRIKAYMDSRNLRELKGDVLPGLGYRKNGGQRAVEVLVPPEDLPEQFQRVTTEADKEAVREYMAAAGIERLLDDGRPIARLAPQGESLRIL